MGSGRDDGDRAALFDDPKSAVRASLWIGRRKCWLALGPQQLLIGAVVLPTRPDKLIQVYAYGRERSWRGTPTPRRFYDIRRWIWSMNEVFAEGVFPDGVAVRLIDPLTRHTVAESPDALRPVTARVAAPTVTLDEAVDLLGSVKSAYAGYELDARKLLAYPALIDPRIRSAGPGTRRSGRPARWSQRIRSTARQSKQIDSSPRSWRPRRLGRQRKRTPAPSQ